jgi:hypothetical protein
MLICQAFFAFFSGEVAEKFRRSRGEVARKSRRNFGEVARKSRGSRGRRRQDKKNAPEGAGVRGIIGHVAGL